MQAEMVLADSITGAWVSTSPTGLPHVSSDPPASLKHLLNDTAILIMLLANLFHQINYSIPNSNQKLCFQARIHQHIRDT